MNVYREADDTFRMLVKVCDVAAFVRAYGFGADEVAHDLLLAVYLGEGPIWAPLPVDFIAVHLRMPGRERKREVGTDAKCHF